MLGGVLVKRDVVQAGLDPEGEEVGLQAARKGPRQMLTVAMGGGFEAADVASGLLFGSQ